MRIPIRFQSRLLIRRSYKPARGFRPLRISLKPARNAAARLAHRIADKRRF